MKKSMIASLLTASLLGIVCAFLLWGQPRTGNDAVAHLQNSSDPNEEVVVRLDSESSRAVCNDIVGWAAYSDHKAMALVRNASGTEHWDGGSISPNSTSAQGTGGDTLDTYGSNGVWSMIATGGTGVTIGDHIRTVFDIMTTAQNKSRDAPASPDVTGRVTFERTSGSHDLRSITYEWR